MIRRDGDSLFVEGALTLGTVSALADAAREHLRGARVVDFRGVSEVDSSAVALALEWLRQAAESKSGLRLVNLPVAMKNLAKKMQRFLTSEDGPTAVEYAVMLALIIIVCLTAINAIGTKANTTFTNVGNSIGT